MKKIKILAAFMLFSGSGMAQSWEFGSGFSLSQPVSSMANTMNNAFGIDLEVARVFKSPVSLGIEVGFANYGAQTSRQSYQFDDGSITETDVIVSHEIYNVQLTGKYFFRANKKVNPYVSGKLGIAWFATTLTIEDPEDEFSCHPLESDVLSSHHTYIASGGAGVRVDFKSFFRKMPQEKFYFDLSVHSSQGGAVKYMNSEIDPSQPAPEEDVTAKFINTQTQVIHEHHVGYIYTSLVNMVEYRLGVIFRLN